MLSIFSSGNTQATVIGGSTGASWLLPEGNLKNFIGNQCLEFVVLCFNPINAQQKVLSIKKKKTPNVFFFFN